MVPSISARLPMVALLFLLCAPSAVAQQRQITAEQLLKQYVPIQKGVEFDTPKPEDIPKCRLVQEKNSFVIYGPANEPLRRFTDSNGDGPPDIYHYYRLGLEVYREIDTNGDHKAKRNTRPDQFRWMNWGGTRWGVDANEDGRIESWKIISAQEAARVAVEALIAGDLAALESVIVTDAEIEALRLPAPMARQLKEASADLAKKAKASLAAGRILNAQSTWVRFDAALPGLVPAEQSGAAQDLMVYENAMAYVQNGEKLELVSIGEMVLAGNSWKLVSVPTPLDTSGTAVIALGGVLMQTGLGAAAPAAAEMSPEMQKLLSDLQKLDENSPQADATTQALANYNIARANLAEKLIGQARTDEERAQWIQQFTDSLSTATQSGLYQDGLARLQKLENAVRPNTALLGYVYYRRLMAEYAVRLKQDDKTSGEAEARAAREATQKWWFEQLEAFARQWPNSDDAPDAVVQLAISYELMGRIDDAKAWYGQLAKNYPQTDGGIKAAGALKRLNLIGNPLQISGRNLQNQTISNAQYRGKVLLVVFWASYAQPFVDDLEAIQTTFTKHQKDGFEILGVNLDPDPAAANALLTKAGIRWQNLRDTPAQPGAQPGDFGFGIVSLPTMFLVNREGIVEGGITAKNLELAVETLIQGKKLESLRPAEPNPAEPNPNPNANPGSARSAETPRTKQ